MLSCMERTAICTDRKLWNLGKCKIATSKRTIKCSSKIKWKVDWLSSILTPVVSSGIHHPTFCVRKPSLIETKSLKQICFQATASLFWNQALPPTNGTKENGSIMIMLSKTRPKPVGGLWDQSKMRITIWNLDSFSRYSRSKSFQSAT